MYIAQSVYTIYYMYIYVENIKYCREDLCDLFKSKYVGSLKAVIWKTSSKVTCIGPVWTK